MGRTIDLVKREWLRLLIWRYQKKQTEAARQDRDAVERLVQQREGGSPYAPAPMPRTGI